MDPKEIHSTIAALIAEVGKLVDTTEGMEGRAWDSCLTGLQNALDEAGVAVRTRNGE